MLLVGIMSFATEMCVTSVEGCIVAEELGANRVELCTALSEGGLTPSLGLVREARRVLKATKLYVLIRPRAGDFVYSEHEVAVMCEDIAALAKEGIDGVVIGALTTKGKVDTAICNKMIVAAGNLGITFHRAFDMVDDKFEALETIIALGKDAKSQDSNCCANSHTGCSCSSGSSGSNNSTGNSGSAGRIERILTSGGRSSAHMGIQELEELCTKAAGRIAIMAGAGISEDNILDLATKTKVREFHFSAKSDVPAPVEFTNPEVFMGLPGKSEYTRTITDAHKAKEIIEKLKSLS